MTVRRPVVRTMPIVLAAIALPFVVGMVVLGVHASDFAPWADTAVNELAVREVGSSAVLVGPYSRFGWHHPGPMLFYALAVPYRLTGASSIGLDIAALLIAWASAAGVVMVMWRRCGTPLAVWAAIGLGGFLAFLGADLLRDSWNPYVTILPFLLFVLLAWTTSVGDNWTAVGAIVVGSFLVQTHIGYLPVVVGVAAGMIVIRLARHRLRGQAAPLPSRRVVLVGLGAGVVCWIPPLLDQAFRTGNLGDIAGFFRAAEGGRSLADGAERAVIEIGAPLADVLGVEGAIWPGFVLVAVLGACGIVAWRRRDADTLAIVVLGGVVVILGAISVARIIGPVEHYLVIWIAVVAVLVWLVVGLILHPWLENRRFVTIGAAVVVLVFAADAVAAGRAGAPEAKTSSIVAAFGDQAIRAARGVDGPIVVGVGTDDLWPWAAGVVLALERAGFDARVTKDLGVVLGDRILAPARADRCVDVVVDEGAGGVVVRRMSCR